MNELPTVADGVDGGHMKGAISIAMLFMDIGGVLLTNAWDYHACKRAAGHFKLSGPRWRIGIA